MTKRNIVALCGLLAASGLQAGQNRWQGSQITEALGKIRQGTYGAATRVASSAPSVAQVTPLASHVASGENVIGSAAQQAYATANQGVQNIPQITPQGLRTQASNAFYTGWENLKGKSGYLWNRGGEVLGSARNKIAEGWDWSKNQPYLGRLTQSLGSLGTTAAGYATNPYIAQNIAQRLPSSASFIKDYPTTTNVAALAAAAGAGYGLYKGGQYASDWYYGPLDSQINNLIKQENTKDLSEQRKASIHSNLDLLLVQKAEQIAGAIPNEGVYDKVRRLRNFLANNKFMYPSKFANDTFSYYIYSIAIGNLEKHQNNLLAQADLLKKRALQAETEEEMNFILDPIQEIYSEIDSLTSFINKLIKERAAFPAPQQQNTGYFGWLRRK